MTTFPETNLKKDIQKLALKLLARREHGYHELRLKLLQRNHPHELINAVLDDCVNKGWLSDKRFAEAYARDRSQRGYGPLRISLELQEKGVNNDIVESVIDPNDESWIELAKKVQQKKFSQYPESFIEKKTQEKFLYYRGFTSAQIESVF